MLAVALAACSPQPGADSGALDSAIEDTGAMDSATAEDASVDTGALQDVASERPFVPSGCPAPAVIAPTATFTGFLPPVNAEYVRTVDGDTAHFLVAGVEITANVANEGGGAIFFVSNNRTGSLVIRDSVLRRNPSMGFETMGLRGIFMLAAPGNPMVSGSVIE